jgi:DivIVA domain-containing protein
MTVTSRSGERLTPDQVQSITFPPARFGHRGLDEEQVRGFCARVEHELVTLLNEKAALWEEVERLRRRIIGDSGDKSGLRPEDAHIQAVRILSNAQQTADRYVADAQEYSRQLTEDARRRRDELLGEARVHADRVLDEARSQATRAMETVTAGPVAVSNGEWRDRTAELAYLRTFSEVYRTHLRAYLEALLSNVRDWERSETSSLVAAGAKLPSPARYPAAPSAYPSPASSADSGPYPSQPTYPSLPSSADSGPYPSQPPGPHPSEPPARRQSQPSGRHPTESPASYPSPSSSSDSGPYPSQPPGPHPSEPPARRQSQPSGRHPTESPASYPSPSSSSDSGPYPSQPPGRHTSEPPAPYPSPARMP